MRLHNLQDTKSECIARIIDDYADRNITRILVVGCGSGIEAAILAEQLSAECIGIDVIEDFHSTASLTATLQWGDAMDLEFDDSTFDLIYSYHALEHIADPVLALNEIHRVLQVNGIYWIGTPNRSRVVGYLGSNEATLTEKLKWNLTDWKARLTGNFRNEYGAHAGFSRSELAELLWMKFSTVNDVSDAYYSAVYSRHPYFLAFLRKSHLASIAYPSVYFMGRK